MFANKMRGKKFISMLAGLACIASLVTPAHAEEYLESSEHDDSVVMLYDESRNGTIKIDYKDTEDGNPVEGAVFSYYRVAGLTAEVNTSESEVEPVAEVGSKYVSIIPDVEINSETNPEEIQETVLEFYKDQKVPRGITDENGTATTELATGAYLAVETRPAMGHLPSTPFLFTMPGSNQDEELGITNGWNYNVKAEPKALPVSISTTLVDGTTGIHESEYNGKAEFIDTVAYTGLIPGDTYTMRGSLIAEDGTPYNITAKETFVAQESDGIVELHFTQDTSELVGKHIVAFEDLFIHKISHDETDINEGETPDKDGTNHTDDLENNETNKVSDGSEIETDKIRVATHSDLSDKDQTVSIVRIRTSLNSDTGRVIDSVKKKLTDTVKLEGLIIGETYTVEGTLMDKEEKVSTGVKGSTTFEATAKTMYVNIDFNVNASKFTGKSLVAFEKLYHINNPKSEEKREKIPVAEHEDYEDEKQTVDVVRIRTTLKDKESSLHETKSGVSSLVDTISYSGLKPNKTYTIKGTLMNKTTKKPISAKGGQRSFTPQTESGTVTIEFTLDTSSVAGGDIVAFEELWMNTDEAKGPKDEESVEKKKPEVKSENNLTKIAEHKDLKDESQTVRVIKIGTTLKDKETDSHNADAKKLTLVDTVDCKGLVVGHHYILVGELMDKESQKSIADAKPLDFVAKDINETHEITFEIDASGMEGKSLVAFETLYYNAKYYTQDTKEEKVPDTIKDDRVKVAEHKDYNDQNQTVTINRKPNPTPTPTPTPTPEGGKSMTDVKTGDQAPIIGLVVALIAAGCVLFLVFRKKKNVN